MLRDQMLDALDCIPSSLEEICHTLSFLPYHQRVNIINLNLSPI